MDVNFRTACASDKLFLRRLWVEAFGDEQPWTDWFFSTHHHLENIWVGIGEGGIVAQVHLLPHILHIRGSEFPACYLVGVSVAESLRGTGIGKELMISAMKEADRRGYVIGILQPRYPDFYRKLGWDYFCVRQIHRVTIPASGWRQNDARDYDQAVSAEIQELNLIYQRFTDSLHAWAIRNRKHWENLLTDHLGDGGQVRLIRKAGNPEAYALFHFRFGNLVAREIGYVDECGRESILGILANEAAKNGCEWMEWTDPNSTSFGVTGQNIRQEPFLMARLIHVDRLLAKCVPAVAHGRVCLDITDGSGLSLEQVKQLRFQKNGIRLSEGSSLRGTIALDSDALAQLVFGYKSVSELMAERRLRSSDLLGTALLGRAFPNRTNYISEYF